MNEKVDAPYRRRENGTIDSLGSGNVGKPDWNAASRETLFCFVSERELQGAPFLRLKSN
jgi:hypothetical protein